MRNARKALKAKTGKKVVSQANDLSAPTSDLLADNEPAQPTILKTSPPGKATQRWVGVRIKTLSLTDFRAFHGPAPTTFELDCKNLLLYGENGSGKSFFHALRGFFSLGKPAELVKLRNSLKITVSSTMTPPR